MRELSACDFCGDEPSGVYEVVPGDIPGVSARRMVLCADCRDILADIVDPLLAAGRRSGRSKKPSPDDASDASEDQSTTEPAGASGAGADSEPLDDSTSSAATASESSTDDGADRAGASTSASGDATADAAHDQPDDSGDGADGDAAAASAAGSDAASGGGQQVEQKRIERPPNYGKVVRLVENRDAGIPRADLETLASSAYDISPTEVEKAIETALTEGRFRETKDGLQTT